MDKNLSGSAKMVNPSLAVNQRCLLRIHGKISEYVVLEISPSGRFVKLKETNGVTWVGVCAITLIEALP